MNRITPLDPSDASTESAELLTAVQKKMGMTPNMTKVMAHAPRTLKSYLDFAANLGATSLSPKLREKIALVVAETNGCDYCLSAHSAIGGSLGLDAETLLEARAGRADDPKEASILAFARACVVERGHVGERDLDRARTAGVSDQELMETIAAVALNTFTNIANSVAQTEIDFPKAPALNPA